MFTLEERNVLFVFVIKMLLLLSRIFVPPVAFSAYITSRYTRLVISSRKLVLLPTWSGSATTRVSPSFRNVFLLYCV